MAKSGNRRTRTSPPTTALPSITTVSTNPVSSSPYFLPDLIPLVASRLTTLEDFFALRAACRAYRARLPLSSSNLASQGPLLLVRHKPSTSEALFHVPVRRILRFRLPRSRRDPILTCFRWLFPARVAPGDPSPTSFHSFGCRVAIQDASRPELRIRHILTGKRAGARLPDPPEECDAVIFSGDLIIAFTRLRRGIYYCRIGDAHWRAAWCHGGYQLYSLVSMKGTLYALIYPNYGLATVELDNNSVVLSFLEDKLSAETFLNCSTLWLAECHGELLLTVRTTSTYHVFRWKSGESKWARTESLGGCSLFFNIHEFAGCLGPDHPAVRRDCLYFTGWSGNWRVYSLVDGSLHEHVVEYPGRGARKDYVPLAWVLPSIC